MIQVSKKSTHLQEIATRRRLCVATNDFYIWIRSIFRLHRLLRARNGPHKNVLRQVLQKKNSYSGIIHTSQAPNGWNVWNRSTHRIYTRPLRSLMLPAATPLHHVIPLFAMYPLEACLEFISSVLEYYWLESGLASLL